MKSTGIIRQLDNLGRIVIPIEMRRKMNLAIKDSVEIFVEGDRILLKKYEPGCVFCGSTRGLKTYKDKLICRSCRESLIDMSND